MKVSAVEIDPKFRDAACFAVRRETDGKSANWHDSEALGYANRFREKCRLLPQVLPNAKLRQIAQIKNLTELLNYLAPREWVRTIDRTGNNRLLYRLTTRESPPHPPRVPRKK